MVKPKSLRIAFENLYIDGRKVSWWGGTWIICKMCGANGISSPYVYTYYDKDLNYVQLCNTCYNKLFLLAKMRHEP